jgi:hypothetical protein
VGSDPYFCFQLHNDPSHSPAILVFGGTAGESILRVLNIISGQRSELSMNEYNALLDRFAEEVVVPSVAGTTAIWTTSGAEAVAADVMDPRAASLLERFSGLANKSTGSSHLVRLHRCVAPRFTPSKRRPTRAVACRTRWVVK